MILGELAVFAAIMSCCYSIAEYVSQHAYRYHAVTSSERKKDWYVIRKPNAWVQIVHPDTPNWPMIW